MSPLLVIAVTALFGVLSAWVSLKNQTLGGYWTLAGWASGMVCPWFIIARFSKNLIFDGMLFDVSIITAFYLTLMCISNKHISTAQYVAAAFCIGGMIAFKLLEGK